MKLHYLFGTRYDVADENNTEDWRHRNAVFGVHNLLHRKGYDIQYHYHNDDMLYSLSFEKNDIAINLHPGNPVNIDPMRAAKADGARCGVFMDISDFPLLDDKNNTILTAIKEAHFVIVPCAHAARKIIPHNPRTWVVPPVIELPRHLPRINMESVKSGQRALGITSIVEPHQQGQFLNLVAGLSQTASQLYPINLDVFIRQPTGHIPKPDIETFRQTILGMVLLGKNRKLSAHVYTLNKEGVASCLNKSDILLVSPSDNSSADNIKQPLLGINAGLMVLLPEKSKNYASIYSMGSVPYRPEQLRTVLAGVITDPTLHFTGKLARGQNNIKQHHTPAKIAEHYDMVFQNEIRQQKRPFQYTEQKSQNFWNLFKTMDNNDEMALPLSIIQHHPNISARLENNDKKEVRVREMSKT